MELSPTLEQISDRLARQPVVPVYHEFHGDTLTPVSAYLSLTNGAEASGFMLESVEQGENLGRYTFLSAEPRGKITCEHDQFVADGAIDLSKEGDPFDQVSNMIEEWDIEVPAPLPGFTGGLVGYLGYEMIQYIEPTVNTKDPDQRTPYPNSILYLVDTMLIFDHLRRTCYLVDHVRRDREESVKEQIVTIRQRLSNWKNRLKSPVEAPPIVSHDQPLSERLQSNFTQEQFEEGVISLKQSIREGDIFQAVPSQRFTVSDRNHPFNLYRRLRSVNPSPYMYFLDFDDFQLVGSSPEILAQKEGSEARVRPIAGTRRRGENEQEDRKLEKELLSDEKEQAEHTMLVDLGRNDLGRVCKPGTVTVTDRAIIERYSHVMHMVSNVVGEVDRQNNAVDILRATFPAGTVTGAPKVRAMQLIEEIEPDRRGPYAGAVGYIGYNGDLDTCIVIRTMVTSAEEVHVQAGAGIVTDSDPAREYEETREKARALLQAVESLSESSFF